MIHNIHPSLVALATPVGVLRPLEDNPRGGNVPALMRSYEKYGQLKGIVTWSNGDGTYTVMSGNHQLEAAINLGWTHVACTEYVGTFEDALAFAMLENRWGELGTIDKDLLHQHLELAYDANEDIFGLVGWDDFEMAAMEVSNFDAEGIPTGRAGGYEAPVMIAPTVTPVSRTDGEETMLTAPAGTDERSAVIAGVGGATSQAAAPKKAAAQYTIMFDDAAQMGRWWDFLRMLRASTVYYGDTIAARLMDFADQHGEF